MKNLKVFKGIIPVLFAGTVLISLSGCNKKEKKQRQENLIGYIDIKNPDDIASSDFICYNVGNYKKVGITEQSKKLKKCEENNISTAIIIDSEATKRLDIFEDIEFTKSILEEYSIDLPVYLNIENIMKNESLSMTDKISLINEYLLITEKNNIYVGLYGTSTNLEKINKNSGSMCKKYDCFVIEDGITEYNGLSSIKQDINGNIKSTYQSMEYQNNLASFIKSENKNNPARFKQNGYHIVESNYDIENIAMKYNISINDILSYNKIKKEDIKEGTILRIPNQIQDKKELVFPELKRQDKALYYGIDMSLYQGEPNRIDFKKLSENIDFAVLKIGEQLNNDYRELREDPYFKDYYNECKANEISIGGYYVTHATTVEQAVEEAKLIADRVKNLDITYPIYIDYENIPNSEYEKEFKKIKQTGKFKQIIEEVNKVFKDAGLRFGIYANLSTYDEMVNMVGLETLNQYEIWLARPQGYTNTNEIVDNGSICRTDDGKYSYGCDMNQVSWTISNIGINGNVDFNLCYKDYEEPKYIVELPAEQIFETQTYNRKDYKHMAKTGTKICSVAVALFIFNKKRKRIKRRIARVLSKRKNTPKTNIPRIEQYQTRVYKKVL